MKKQTVEKMVAKIFETPLRFKKGTDGYRYFGGETVYITEIHENGFNVSIGREPYKCEASCVLKDLKFD